MRNALTLANQDVQTYEMIAEHIARRVGEILIKHNIENLIDKIYINSYVESNEQRPCFSINIKFYLDESDNLRQIIYI